MRPCTLRFIALAFLVRVFSPAIALSGSAEFPDKLEFVQMLREGKVKLLDARVSGYQRAYEAAPIKEKEELVAFTVSAFENSDPGLEPKLNEWIAQMPGSYSARVARGSYYRHLGWLSRGANYASETAREHMSRMRGYFDRAALDYREALSMNPKLSVAYASLIEMAMVYGDRKSTEELLRKALQIDPYSFEVRQSYLFALQPKWGGSAQEMKQFVGDMEKHVPKNPGLAILQGYINYTEANNLQRAGKRREAVELYNRALQFGNHAEFFYARGKNYYWLDDYNRALADFDDALKLRPQVPAILAQRGEAYHKLGEFDEAMKDFNAALQLDPLFPDAWQGRSRVFWSQKRFNEALQDIENALKLQPHDAYNLWNKGRLLLRLKDYSKAASSIKRASELRPEVAGIWYDYGQALHHQGDCAAVDALDRYLTLCNRGQTCTPKQREWAVGVIKDTGRSFTCPKK